ncbi:MAG: 16S rRNA (adenine(1518)-N(6)/adenine(1519)-N(6))-dimethyltransferase RsmA [Dehalococcoidia bacterium]
MAQQLQGPGAALAPGHGRKRLGQHFLHDRRVLAHLVRAIAPSPGDTIVEVGAGPGILTGPLAQSAGKVVAVEVDEALCQRLSGLAQRHPNVVVVCADVLSLPVVEVLRRGDVQGAYTVVGNLPYYIAAAVVRHFLEAERQPQRLVVTIQKEVAENMAAAPGHMTLLGACVQFYGQPRILFSIPPQAFSPAPKVWSAVVRVDVRPQPAVAVEDRGQFFALLRAGFRAPRKQLRNALALGLGLDAATVEALLATAAIDATRRAQTLTLSEWGALYEAWRALHVASRHPERSEGSAPRRDSSLRSE